jgi:hypothetical protein
MDFETLLTSLVSSKDKSWRKSALPEASDFSTWLAQDTSPSQYSIMAALIDQTKDELLAKSLQNRALMAV